MKSPRAGANGPAASPDGAATEPPRADWIAVDWGTSRLRAWAMRNGEPVADAASDAGMGALEPAGFEPALLALVEPWLGTSITRVVACGMVGARQGWIEAPYMTAPCRPLGPVVRAPAADPRIAVDLVPGVQQPEPADVMRGEETQIAGFLALDPGFDGVLCLPGTHTKWVEVSAGEIVSFRTFMTGELFALLAKASVLRHSVGDGWNEPAFLDALSDTLSRPETLAARLFGIRAEGLLDDLDPATARSRLSGFLIGAELAAARSYWLGQRIAIIGDPGLAGHYAAALTAGGAAPTLAPADRMTLAGLTAAWASLTDRGTEET